MSDLAGGWYYGIGDQKLGPIALPQLQELVRSGQIGPSVLVWAEGMPEWVPAGRLPVLFPPAAPIDPAMGLLIPVGPQSGMSIAAGYCGLLGFFPFVGPLGILFGILGLRDLKRHPEKKGYGRAITGIVGGSIFTLLYLLPFILRR